LHRTKTPSVNSLEFECLQGPDRTGEETPADMNDRLYVRAVFFPFFIYDESSNQSSPFFGYTNRKNERPHFPLMRKQKRKKARNVLDGVGSAKKPRPKLFEANDALGDNICGVIIPLGRTLTRYITSSRYNMDDALA
jgi:hypothetical protein